MVFNPMMNFNSVQHQSQMMGQPQMGMAMNQAGYASIQNMQGMMHQNQMLGMNMLPNHQSLQQFNSLSPHQPGLTGYEQAQESMKNSSLISTINVEPLDPLEVKNGEVISRQPSPPINKNFSKTVEPQSINTIQNSPEPEEPSETVSVRTDNTQSTQSKKKQKTNLDIVDPTPMAKKLLKKSARTTISTSRGIGVFKNCSVASVDLTGCGKLISYF